MYIHKEGYKYIFLGFLFAVGLTLLAQITLGAIPVLYLMVTGIVALLWLWIVWFFRIPKRLFTYGEDLILSPADGKVVVIEETMETEFFKEKRLQVSIFMSPLNVHVNRSPIKGKVSYTKYHPGKYLVAWHPKSSTENERATMVIENEKGALLLRQIAGAMARRICCYIAPGDELAQNAEFGFIRFGSRVDMFLPLDTQIEVKLNQAVKGGQTVIARW